ncbi:MAG: hypothetical protein F4086_04765 [Gemmatimonadetes bacterium]|nr:hypothetical protein [Gemmatimonadota bacterium]
MTILNSNILEILSAIPDNSWK